jgi:hypothetical protein
MPKNLRPIPTENPRRTAKSVISLTQFAHSKSKGTRRAIEHYKQKKQSKFNRKAGLLREYKKAMKSEGFEAGKGASRKRTRGNEPEDLGETDKVKRRHKADPFAKAKEKARQNKEAIFSKKQEHQENMKLKHLNEKRKKIRGKQLNKRTRKGQPIMKNVIGDILQKIKADV